MDRKTVSRPLSAAEAHALMEALDAGRGPQGFERRLRAAGLDEIDAAWANLERLFRLLLGEQFVRLLPDLLGALGRSADPKRSLRNWVGFLGRAFDPFALGQRLAGTPGLMEFLTCLFGFSQFLSDLLIRNPEYLDWLRSPKVLDQPKTLQDYQREVQAAIEVFQDPSRQRHALCRCQRKELLRIGVRDMLGRGSLAERMAELSDLAEAIVDLALRLCRARLVKRYGRPIAEETPGEEAVFAVAALGKLGGRELNFSSDIDLIFLYSEEGQTEGAGPGGPGRISNHLFFTRLGEELVNYLSSHGPEGFLYRVDLRLRPDGESGPLVRSLVGVETYYLTQARLWERLAFVKARLIAGGGARFAASFQDLAEHFVYGLPLGSEIFAELGDVKVRIDRQVEDRGVADREVKRGWGGIREIEFIVGALQLLHGHLRPEMRVRPTLEALEAIERLGLLAPEDCRALAEAYAFFRNIEHRLQMLYLRRTHLLPDDPAELRMLARRCGVQAAEGRDPGKRFRDLYARRASDVRRVFEALFGQAPASRSRRQGVEILLDPGASKEEQFRVLEQQRFRDPAILDSFRSLAFGHREVYLSAQGQEFFESILPRFLEECARVPQPEQAVRLFDAFLLRLKGIAATYAFIVEHPVVLRILLRLFGVCESLSRILLSHPEFLDVIVDAEILSQRPSGAALRARAVELARRRAAPGAFQAALSRFKDLEFLAAGVRDLQGIVAPEETAEALSDIAEACVAGAMEAAGLEAAEAEALSEPPAGLAVLAMGKLGGREMNFFSDLDLVFIHGEAPKGVKDAAQFFSRWAQGVVRLLAEVTPAGTVFKVDTRLRPEGRNAPLVAPLGRYQDYYASRAQAWEFQSLLKSRWAAGDQSLIKALRQGVMEPMARLGQRPDLSEAVRSMRGRIESAVRLPSWAGVDFKRSRGGVVDLEFLAQYLQLRGLGAHPGLFVPSFGEALGALEAHGLIDGAQAKAVRANYGFLRLLESRSRLLYSTTSNYLPQKPNRLEPLEFFMRETIAEGQTLTRAVQETMAENRRLFDQIV